MISTLLLDDIRQQNENSLKLVRLGISLAVRWIGLRASTAGGAGLIPDWGSEIPHAALHGK